jgi:predicted nucleic-acid-binding Zn-ribbon protein
MDKPHSLKMACPNCGSNSWSQNPRDVFVATTGLLPEANEFNLLTCDGCGYSVFMRIPKS